jgi:adenylate kinase family enzyme
MARIVIVGNASGGKSTLARKLSSRRKLPLTEIDQLLWQPGWKLTPPELYARRHAEIVRHEAWVIEGLGSRDSIPERMARATEIILIDLPLWVHFWLAAERQMSWAAGRLSNAPAGAANAPPTKELFKTMWDVDQEWMPSIRSLCDEAEKEGKTVLRLRSIDDLDALTRSLEPAN